MAKVTTRRFRILKPEMKERQAMRMRKTKFQLRSSTPCLTDLFTPLTLDVGNDGGRAFYLANVEAFVRTCIVIPDIGDNGDPTNEYFEVKPRSLWAKEFIGWLRRPHKEDEMDWTDFEDEKLKLEEEKRKKEEEKRRKALEKEEEKQRKAQEKQRSKRRKP